MDSREQFQQWWEKFYEGEPRESWSILYSPEHDYYIDGDIDGQYDAWKASRAAIEITPPEFVTSRMALAKGYTVDYSSGYGDAMDAYEEKIRAAGISIKGDE